MWLGLTRSIIIWVGTTVESVLGEDVVGINPTIFHTSLLWLLYTCMQVINPIIRIL